MQNISQLVENLRDLAGVKSVLEASAKTTDIFDAVSELEYWKKAHYKRAISGKSILSPENQIKIYNLKTPMKKPMTVSLKEARAIKAILARLLKLLKERIRKYGFIPDDKKAVKGLEDVIDEFKYAIKNPD